MTLCSDTPTGIVLLIRPSFSNYRINMINLTHVVSPDTPSCVLLARQPDLTLARSTYKACTPRFRSPDLQIPRSPDTVSHIHKTNKMKSLNIALIHEQRSSYLDSSPGHSEEHCAALPHDGEVQAVESTLKALGHAVTLVPGIEALVAQLADNKHATWDLAFNMAQGFYGSTRESQVPALLEAYRIPYTFSDAATMASCQNKATSKVFPLPGKYSISLKTESDDI